MEVFNEGRTIALIPARSGSKRVEGKNTRILAGKPLIQWTIEAAKQAKGIHEIVVSSNDSIVKRISSDLNIKFLERPESLCDDESKISDVIAHFIGEFPDYENLILLQPTCPFRSADFIEKSLSELNKFRSDIGTAVVSVTEHAAPLEWLFTEDKKSLFLKPVIEFEELQFQQTTKVYTFSGSVYCANILGLKKANYVFGKMQVRPILQEISEALDIDSEEDFLEAERIMNQRKP